MTVLRSAYTSRDMPLFILDGFELLFADMCLDVARFQSVGTASKLIDKQKISRESSWRYVASSLCYNG